jgi:hypothetical protein
MGLWQKARAHYRPVDLAAKLSMSSLKSHKISGGPVYYREHVSRKVCDELVPSSHGPMVKCMSLPQDVAISAEVIMSPLEIRNTCPAKCDELVPSSCGPTVKCMSFPRDVAISAEVIMSLLEIRNMCPAKCDELVPSSCGPTVKCMSFPRDVAISAEVIMSPLEISN